MLGTWSNFRIVAEWLRACCLLLLNAVLDLCLVDIACHCECMMNLNLARKHVNYQKMTVEKELERKHKMRLIIVLT